MQQPPQMTGIPPRNITTEQIQMLLEENKKLILAILDHQNHGRFSECAIYQAQLQKNLMFLAAIADAQPQEATGTNQVTPNSGKQQNQNMQQPQAATSQQHAGGFPQMPSFQFKEPQDQQLQQQLTQQFQQQQAIQGNAGMGAGGFTSLQSLVQSQPGNLQKMMDIRGSKQDGSQTASSNGQGMLGFAHHSRIREP